MYALPIYMDNNATTCVDHHVMEAMLPFFTKTYGNAASKSHSFGWAAEQAVDVARKQTSALIGCEPNEIIFTSGATESINLALKGVFELYSSKGNHIITVCTEHKAVLDTCSHLKKMGAEITYLHVNKNGLIDINELKQKIRKSTVLTSVMYANNETGVIQNIKEIGEVAKEKGILFFSDATQAVGKVSVDVLKDQIDILSLSGHKMYGPKGAGALYVRRKNPRVRLISQIDGGGHERGLRSGTLNVPGIVGLGKASEICNKTLAEESRKITLLRDYFEQEIKKSDITINGGNTLRTPNTSNISFNKTASEQLLPLLTQKLAVSSGSACTSDTLEPSYVLRAMGLSAYEAKSSIRFSLGRFNTKEEIDFAIKYVSECVERIK
ncbi:MAG: aminotransferase class V-fold PLP-dependent enzyme [Bacteroidetes bacterium]|nr:aminotransferase class V-fold PLP-dependent enzyme [Bacteroidota bacterium]